MENHSPVLSNNHQPKLFSYISSSSASGVGTALSRGGVGRAIGGVGRASGGSTRRERMALPTQERVNSTLKRVTLL